MFLGMYIYFAVLEDEAVLEVGRMRIVLLMYVYGCMYYRS